MPEINTNSNAVMFLRKHRMNAGYTAREYAKKVGIGYDSVLKIEQGREISRILAGKYLAHFGFSLNRPESLPRGLKVIDAGEAVRLLSDQ